MQIQDPLTQSPAVSADLVQQLQALGWVDHTAIAVLLVFFVLGLFKGLIWQVSRIAILVVAYAVAGRFGHAVAGLFSSTPPEQMARDAMSDPSMAPGEATLYIAYVLLFLAVLVVLSLLAMLLKKLADKAGLSFFDRLGGGVLGVATGAAVVLALVFFVNMFFPQSHLAEAARTSHSLRFSQQAIDWLGAAVNDDLRSVLSLRPLTGEGDAGRDGAEPGEPGSANAGSEFSDGNAEAIPSPDTVPHPSETLPLPGGRRDGNR